MDGIFVPFRGGAALDQGLVSRRALRRHYTRIYPDTYVYNDVEVDARIRARAVWCWSGGRGVLAGPSAAALWGTRWIDATAPNALCSTAHLRPPPGIAIYRDCVPDTDIATHTGIPLTGPLRTAFDLGRRLEFDRAVEAVDALYQSTGITRAELAAYAETRSGERGIIQLRSVIEESDEGAESPWETRTRLALVRAGLPRPATQLTIHDDGRFVGRVDMAWERWRVIVEYDGDHHFEAEQRNRDIERWNALETAGWRVIRVKARQLTSGRATLIAQVTRVLRDAGAPV
ncbi:DUF559 domain-containing protein [Prescottella defluvii]|uniref:DUF559 domain-containing protein n=1 Tax=Prescottella defluvii TaxID=1323361 RepID=UPI0004F2CC4A|nr:DUF559 domain-containing protein [Prescottella defluvii]